MMLHNRAAPMRDPTRTKPDIQADLLEVDPEVAAAAKRKSNSLLDLDYVGADNYLGRFTVNYDVR